MRANATYCGVSQLNLHVQLVTGFTGLVIGHDLGCFVVVASCLDVVEWSCIIVRGSYYFVNIV